MDTMKELHDIVCRTLKFYGIACPENSLEGFIGLLFTK